MENGPFIDGLPIKHGDFPWQTVSHNQMVSDICPFSSVSSGGEKSVADFPSEL